MKTSKLPLFAKKGVFTQYFDIEHGRWTRDIEHLVDNADELLKSGRKITRVTITDWVCRDEQGTVRGQRHLLNLDVTNWFLGPRGPIKRRGDIKGISFAQAINQLPTVRTPWVHDIRMDLKLAVEYTSVALQ